MPPPAEKESKETRKLRREIRSLRIGGDTMDLFGDAMPAEFLTDYPVDDLDSQLSRTLQKKYRTRSKNTRRCWNRVQLFLPELMHHDMAPQRVLEMSTAHGAMLEILRHFGHDVLGNDYVNMVSVTEDNQRAVFRSLNADDFHRDLDDYGLPIPKQGQQVADWPYRRIIESINIPMALFDAGQTPYPLKDKDFDVLLCMQAIEHYCHPKDWMRVVDEFTRITRKTIVLMLNPLMNLIGQPDDYVDAYHQAKRDLRGYRRNGFTCTSCHMHWGEPAAFKITAD